MIQWPGWPWSTIFAKMLFSPVFIRGDRRPVNTPQSSNAIQMTSHEHQVVSNQLPFGCLFNNLSRPTAKKHQSPHYWPFVWAIHWWPVNSPHKGPATGKSFHFMTSSCKKRFSVMTLSWNMHCCCRFVMRKVPWQHLKCNKLAYKFKNANQVLFTWQEANYLHKNPEVEWHKPAEVYWPFQTLS